MKSLVTCLMLMVFWVASSSVVANDAKGGAASGKSLSLLPETPEYGQPVLVYLDAEAKEGSWKWFAFLNGQPLALKHATNGGWLKIGELKEEGTYTFVAAYTSPDEKPTEVQRAATFTIKVPVASKPVRANVPPLAMGNQTPQTTSGQPQEKTRTAIRKTIDMLLPISPLNSDGNRAPSNSSTTTELNVVSAKLKLSEALEKVARDGIEQHWKAPRIVQETKSAWTKLEGTADSFLWNHVENLLKDASLQFDGSQVKESPQDAILVVATLAAVLRETDRIQNDEKLLKPQRSTNESNAVMSTTNGSDSAVYSIAVPCCQNARSRRR